MRTLQYKSKYKQRENALETLDIFAPLAYYIGAYRIKSELEDLSFRYSLPDEYKKYLDLKLKIEEDSDSCLKKMLVNIKEVLESHNIPNEIKIRTMNAYGIYKRIEAGNNISDIHDLLALKIMVDEIYNCYTSLGLVHHKYHPVNDKFKDFICNPKTNMYQSLHTTVFGPENRLVQAQIRTFDMDKIASFGLTAYWDINKGEARKVMQEDLKSKYQFFKSLIEINLMFGDNQEFVKQVREELFNELVYVYTRKGDIIELPKGSTPIDFAYKIHTEIGNNMVYAIVNDEEVPLNYCLQNKDRVKIVTDELASGPTDEWLNFVKTSYAKRRIREYRKGK